MEQRWNRGIFRPVNCCSALHFALAAILAVAGAGCTSRLPDGASVIARIEKKQRSRTTSSVQAWREARIGRSDALSYVNRRSAWLLSGATVHVAVRPDHSWEVTAEGGHGGWGTAAAVSQDGYFVTAAHCVEDHRPLTLVAWTGPNRLVKSKARIVWQGDPNGDDVALLKADLRTEYWFRLGAASAPQANDAVLMSGFGGPGPHQSAGRVIEINAAHRNKRGASWRTVIHSAPMVRGDSGSPLVDARGHLVGVNSTILAEYRALPIGFVVDDDIRAGAISVDQTWLQRQIDRDRRRRH